VNHSTTRAVIELAVCAVIVLIYGYYVAPHLFHYGGGEATFSCSALSDAGDCIARRTQAISLAIVAVLVGAIAWVINDSRKQAKQ